MKQSNSVKRRGWSVVACVILCAMTARSQCSNSTQFPATPVIASGFNDTMLVSSASQPGHYFRIEKLELNQTYQFLSSGINDYFTIRDVYTNAVLGHGVPPLSYQVGNGPDLVTVHLNLLLPPCGAESVNRTSTVVCTTCPDVPGSVGIGETNPVARLDIDGEIKLGDVTRPPEAGMVRWNNESLDFEGYNGIQWMSLTKSNGAPGTWGQISSTNIQESQKLVAFDGNPLDQFGVSVGIDGDYAIVGAIDNDITLQGNEGAAYVFVRIGTSWEFQAKLTASDAGQGDTFGRSVSISGDYAIIGANGDDIGGNSIQGSAYVFMRIGNTWSQQAKLTANDGATSDAFGTSVCIHGDYAVIGASGDDIGSNNSQGSAYIFVRSGALWSQQAKLIANDGAANDGFGRRVGIHGDYAVIGAYLDDVGSNTDQGSAYVFVRNGGNWSQQAKLTSFDGAADDSFGNAVSIHGNSVIVGANDSQVGSNAGQGSVYVFIRNGVLWSHQAKLTAVDGAANDNFGVSASIYGDFAMIGASSDDVLFGNQGSAYIFVRTDNTWAQQAKITASDGRLSDNLGFFVCMSAGYAMAGANGDDIGGNSSQGSAYIVKKN